MQAIKGGWVGQTAFAMAQGGDSGARKTRIRRSKEERKATAESFIKQYQKLNNGTFPSLNLTHKEVGGSFYTVREIVREIIQENRVLGPAKSFIDEQNPDNFLKEFPLGAISIEPQTQFSVASDKTSFAIDEGQDKVDMNSNEQFTGPEHLKLDNGKLEGEDKEINENMMKLQDNENSEAGENVEVVMEASSSENTNTRACATIEYSAEVLSCQSPFVLDQHLEPTNQELIVISNSQFVKPENQETNDEKIIQGDVNQNEVTNIILVPVGETSDEGKDIGEMNESAAETTERLAGEVSELAEPAFKISDVSCSSPDLQQDRSEEVLLNSESHIEPESQSSGGSKIINGKRALDNIGTSYVGFKASKTIENEVAFKQMEDSVAKITNITADVVVETFPLRSSTKATLDSYTDEAWELAGAMEENKGTHLRMESENGSSTLSMDMKHKNNNPGLGNKSSRVHVSEHVSMMLGDLVQEMEPGFIGEKEELSNGNVMPASSNTEGGAVNDISDGKDSKQSHNDELASKALGSGQCHETLRMISSDGVDVRSSTATISKPKESISSLNATKTKDETFAHQNSQKEKSSSLDRINLDSWASKRSPKRDTNPILAFFKAFIATFVKFWSD